MGALSEGGRSAEARSHCVNLIKEFLELQLLVVALGECLLSLNNCVVIFLVYGKLHGALVI